MLKDSLGQTYQKVIILQIFLTLVSFIGAWIISGQMAGNSALAGGVSVVTGSFTYAVFAREIKASAKRVFMRHLMGEAAKILVVLVFMLCALSSGWFNAGWLVAAMVIVLAGHWLAILFIR